MNETETKTFILIIPGIESNVSDQFHWSRKFATIFEKKLPNTSAEAYQYNVKWWNRWVFQTIHTKRLLQKLQERSGERVILVGHSNGCDLICRALKDPDCLPVHSIFLFGAATEADFRKNGLNYAVLTGKTRKVYVFTSKYDFVLKRLATVSRVLGKYVGLGYGNLGYAGPKNVMAGVEQYLEVVERPFDHSGWVDNTDLVLERLANE